MAAVAMTESPFGRSSAQAQLRWEYLNMLCWYEIPGAETHEDAIGDGFRLWAGPGSTPIAEGEIDSDFRIHLVLDELGLDGWELVAITPRSENSHRRLVSYTFKRPID